MMPDMPNVGESTRKLGEWVKAHPIPSILMLIGAILIGVWASKNLKGGDKAVLASDELLEDAAGVGMGGAEEIKPTDFDTIVPSGLILPDYTYQQPSKQPTYTTPIDVPTQAPVTPFYSPSPSSLAKIPLAQSLVNPAPGVSASHTAGMTALLTGLPSVLYSASPTSTYQAPLAPRAPAKTPITVAAGRTTILGSGR